MITDCQKAYLKVFLFGYLFFKYAFWQSVNLAFQLKARSLSHSGLCDALERNNSVKRLKVQSSGKPSLDVSAWDEVTEILSMNAKTNKIETLHFVIPFSPFQQYPNEFADTYH